MTLTKIFTAAALTLAAASSYADIGGGPIDLSTGSNFFGRTPVGPTFTDTYTFSIPTSFYLTSGQVGSVVQGNQNIDFTSITIMQGASTLASFTKLSGDPQEIWTLTNFQLAGGSYSLVLNGTQTAGIASYSGNLAITAVPAVPEPETYAMLLAGLGVLGFVARRRKSN